MRYEDLDIAVSVTLGKKAMIAVTQKNELVLVQDELTRNIQVINLGRFTKKDCVALKDYIDRLSIHLPAD